MYISWPDIMTSSNVNGGRQRVFGQTTVNMYMFIQHIQQFTNYVLNQWMTLYIYITYFGYRGVYFISSPSMRDSGYSAGQVEPTFVALQIN